MSYASKTSAPRTLTACEQRRLLRVSGAYSDSYRDHMLFSMALGTGLREHELVALDVADVTNRRGAPRARIELRVFKRSSEDTSSQYVMLSDALRKKLERFLRWKRRRRESLESDAPLFAARGGARLSTRRARSLFAEWRERAELSPRLTFHSLRHTFCQNLYDQTKDIRIVARAARHADLNTTQRYAQPSVEHLVQAISELPC